MTKYSCTMNELNAGMDREAERLDNDAFRAGWARAMRNIAGGAVDAEMKSAIKRDHTRSYYDGFAAGVDHFNGHNTHGTDYARAHGLVDAYIGFYGQLDFEHPTTLPGF
jgi:hypothetical protein